MVGNLYVEIGDDYVIASSCVRWIDLGVYHKDEKQTHDILVTPFVLGVLFVVMMSFFISLGLRWCYWQY